MPIAKLTKFGKALMTQIGRRQFSFFDEGIVKGSGIWSDNLTGEAGADVAKTAKGVALVARKLADDGYLRITETGEYSPWVELTATGAALALSLAADDVPVQAPEVPVEDLAPAPTVKATGKARKAAKAPVAAEPYTPLTKDEQAVTVGLRWYGKVRETKRYVGIYDGTAAGLDTEAGRWATTCEEHGVTENHKTFDAAWTIGAHPLTWCLTCQAEAAA